jgi:hypothetical protein
MSSSLSASERFLLEDSSSSDESDIEDVILDDDVEQTMVVFVVKELLDRMAMKQRRESIPGRIFIPQNRVLCHANLMQDYFAEVPTYPPSLFCRRYRLRRELFVKIVETYEANYQYFYSPEK